MDPSSSMLDLDRAVTKDGVCNFQPKNVESQTWKFMTDIFTTVVEIRWRWTLFAFCFVYFGSWTAFAGLWHLILYIHGDIENFGEEGWVPCVTGIQNFTTSFLFSVETQHTTGYGLYVITEQCSSAIILFCVQSIVGCILEGLMVGVVFVKMTRGKKRGETILFSRKAVVAMRDGIRCFMFRVADMRTTHLLEVNVRAYLLRKRKTAEGESIVYSQEEFEVSGDGERGNKILLFWPTTLIHKIAGTSPLSELLEHDFHPANNTFEIIVVLEGIIESTGLNVQVRSSYLPCEILWDHQFENLQAIKTASRLRSIDYTRFHDAVPVGPNPV